MLFSYTLFKNKILSALKNFPTLRDDCDFQTFKLKKLDSSCYLCYNCNGM